MASICDRCARPGCCCSGFVLPVEGLASGDGDDVDLLLAAAVTCSGKSGKESYLVGYGMAALAKAQADPQCSQVRLGLPFRRLYRAPDGRWRYWCPKLGRDGRCGDYANRPAVCRALEPGGGKPCCHHVSGIGACAERTVNQFWSKKGSKSPGCDQHCEPTDANAIPGFFNLVADP